jgi:hypothetical protein
MEWLDTNPDLLSVMRNGKIPVDIVPMNRPGWVYQPSTGLLYRKDQVSTITQKLIDLSSIQTIRGNVALSENPVMLTALEQMPTVHPDLIESVKTYWSTEFVPSPNTQYEDVSTTRARALTDAMDEWTWAQMADPANRPPDKMSLPATPSLAKPETPKQFLIDVQWRAPTRILAVWNGGPDGDDDRAMVVYDPTNGTISDGDLIQIVEFSSD